MNQHQTPTRQGQAPGSALARIAAQAAWLLISLSLISGSTGCAAGEPPAPVPTVTVIQEQSSTPRPPEQMTAAPGGGNNIGAANLVEGSGSSGTAQAPQVAGGAIANPSGLAGAPGKAATAQSSSNAGSATVQPTGRAGSLAAAAAEASSNVGRVQASPLIKPMGSGDVWIADSPYGVNDWNWNDQAIKAATEVGTTWARLQGVIWRNIEPQPGKFNWNIGPTSNVDEYVARVSAAGMKITAPIWLAPEWAWQPGLTLPRPEPMADFVRAFLSRYPGKIAAVEILAEENTGSWPQTRNRDAIFYAPILKAAYQAAKETSPDTLVVASSLWGSPDGYLEDLYNLGAGGYFDVANFHYYPGSRPASYNFSWWASHLRTVMEKYGDSEKPIWLTEFAWTTTDENRLDGAKSIVSPQEVSDNLAYVLDASRKSGFIDKVFWYTLHDDDGMALMHATDKYGWHTPQPALVGEILPASASLTVAGNWTTRWPTSGTLIVDQEEINYKSLTSSGANTMVEGLSRGVGGAPAAGHTAGATVKNIDQTANFKKQPFYTYKDFIRAYPSWGISDAAPLPDVTTPAEGSVPIRNPGFEEGNSSWSGDFTIDSTEKHSGSASARVENKTGTWTRVMHPALPVEPDRSYLLTAWVKIDPSGSGDLTAMVMANLNDSAGKFLTLAPGNYYIYETAGKWRRIAYPFRTTSGATQVIPFLSTDKGTGVAWFDDISAEPYDAISR